MPFGPALPNGVRTPSTKTTSRNERDMEPPQEWEPPRRGAAPDKLPVGNRRAKGTGRARAQGHPGRSTPAGLQSGRRPSDEAGVVGNGGPATWPRRVRRGQIAAVVAATGLVLTLAQQPVRGAFNGSTNSNGSQASTASTFCTTP